MRKNPTTLLFLCLMGGLWLLPQGLAGQTTYQQVYRVLKNNCSSSSCHGGATPILFDLGDTPNNVYNTLVNATPSNPTAAGKGNKLVDPGHPYNSFLLKKIGSSFDQAWLGLETSEGNQMPSSGAPALGDYEIELVRQWINAGAPQSGNPVDTSLVLDYYSGAGMAMISPPPAPDPDSGYQVRLGPIFIDKLSGSNFDEIEYLKKHRLSMDGDKEVTKLEGFMNWQSHHFLLFEFDDSSAAASEDEGLRVVNIVNNAFDGSKAFTSAWQFSTSFTLPPGTAFFWDKETWLDLNYHIKNYSQDSILAADFYLNVYTQPRGSGKIRMRAHLENNNNLFLWPGQSTETMDQTWGGDDRKIWMISSHTHKYGTDFDIFVRNPNGSKGPQIYEGFYNADYSFNQGFYDWEHPAIRLFDDSLYLVKQTEGLIFETEYNVTQNFPVTFGLTTDDEMQLSTYLYINANEAPVTVDPEISDEPYMTVYPNPAQDKATFAFTSPNSGEMKAELRDYTGRLVKSFPSQWLPAGTHHQIIDFDELGIQSGVYFVRLEINGKSFSTKFVRAK